MTHRFQPEEPAERFSDRHPFFPSRKIRRKRRVKISTFSPIYAKPQRDISLFTARHTFFAAFHSFSNAKMAEGTTEIEIPAVVRPRPGGTPQRPISYGSPLQRAKKKKTMRSRKRPVTPSLVLDKSLPPPFDRYLDLCFLLVLFFFFPLPLPLHPFHPFSRATVTSSNWHVSQFDAYTVSKRKKDILRAKKRARTKREGKQKSLRQSV